MAEINIEEKFNRALAFIKNGGEGEDKTSNKDKL